MWDCQSYDFTVRSSERMRQFAEMASDKILHLIPAEEKKKMDKLKGNLFLYLKCFSITTRLNPRIPRI